MIRFKNKPLGDIFISLNSELNIFQIIEFVGTEMSDSKDLRYFGI